MIYEIEDKRKSEIIIGSLKDKTKTDTIIWKIVDNPSLRIYEGDVNKDTSVRFTIHEGYGIIVLTNGDMAFRLETKDDELLSMVENKCKQQAMGVLNTIISDLIN